MRGFGQYLIGIGLVVSCSGTGLAYDICDSALAACEEACQSFPGALNKDRSWQQSNCRRQCEQGYSQCRGGSPPPAVGARPSGCPSVLPSLEEVGEEALCRLEIRCKPEAQQHLISWWCDKYRPNLPNGCPYSIEYLPREPEVGEAEWCRLLVLCDPDFTKFPGLIPDECKKYRY
jgi:hypothetical protein